MSPANCAQADPFAQSASVTHGGHAPAPPPVSMVPSMAESVLATAPSDPPLAHPAASTTTREALDMYFTRKSIGGAGATFKHNSHAEHQLFIVPMSRASDGVHDRANGNAASETDNRERNCNPCKSTFGRTTALGCPFFQSGEFPNAIAPVRPFVAAEQPQPYFRLSNPSMTVRSSWSAVTHAGPSGDDDRTFLRTVSMAPSMVVHFSGFIGCMRA